MITGALSGTTWFALGKRLPHILSLLQETKDAESSRKCSSIPPSSLRQVGVSKKEVTRGLLVAWTASQAPESSNCAQTFLLNVHRVIPTPPLFFVLIFVYMYMNC